MIQSCTTIPIETIEDYVVCPAKAYMNLTLKEKPAKQVILSMARRGLYDVILASLGKEHLDKMAIARVIDLITSSVGYTEADYDVAYLTEVFDTLDALLVMNELTLTGGVLPFEYTYSGIIIKSTIDFVVKDNVRGLIHPAVLDFSRTRYEPFYNPIVYRAQTIIDHMSIKNHNTDVVVFTPYGNKAKKWSYDKARMSDTVKVSMEEMCHSIKSNLFYHRIGWWCAGCPYRGICYRIMKEHK